MNLLGRGRNTITPRDVLIVQHRLQQALEMLILHGRHNRPQFQPHLPGIAFGRRKVIGELHLAFVHAPHFVDGELRPVVEHLNDALNFDEIVAIEFVEDIGAHVFKHLGVEFAGAVAEEE